MRLPSIVFCLLVLTSSAPALALDANEQTWDKSSDVDFWVYSATWQPTFCLMSPTIAGCDQVPQRLLSHGIWPYANSTDQFTNRHPQNCIDSPSCNKGVCDMDETQLKQVLADAPLRGIVTRDPEGMFKHEWRKHGTCSGKTMGGYFQALVDLRSKVVVLKDPKAFESMIGQATPFSKIRDVFPANTAFRCYRDPAGKQYLHEVFYLIDQQGNPYLRTKSLQIGVQCTEQDTWVPRGNAL